MNDIRRPAHGPKPENLTARRFGSLRVLGYDEYRPRSAGGKGDHRWFCRCDCGATVSRSGEALRRGSVTSCGQHAQKRTGMRQEVVGYSRAHERLAEEFGPARDYLCSECGASAAQWSYDGKDPDELAELRPTDDDGIVLWFSLRPAHYEPRCSACHRRRDQVQRLRRAERFDAYAERELARIEQAEAEGLADELLDRYAPRVSA